MTILAIVMQAINIILWVGMGCYILSRRRISHLDYGIAWGLLVFKMAIDLAKLLVMM